MNSYDVPLAKVIDDQQQTNNIQILPITLPHVLALDGLEPHHKDPFDRLLITQANVEDLVLVSGDQIFSQYSVQLLWDD